MRLAAVIACFLILGALSPSAVAQTVPPSMQRNHSLMKQALKLADTTKSLHEPSLQAIKELDSDKLELITSVVMTAQAAQDRIRNVVTFLELYELVDANRQRVAIGIINQAIDDYRGRIKWDKGPLSIRAAGLKRGVYRQAAVDVMEQLERTIVVLEHVRLP